MKKKESGLAFEVKLSYCACIVWAQSWQEKKKPVDIEESLPRKLDRLKKAMDKETLAFFTKISKRYEEQKMMHDEISPLEFYRDGEKKYNEKKYLEAKEKFLKYRNCVEFKKSGVKNPHEDEHLRYLTLIQDILNEEIAQNDIAVTRKSGAEPQNPYKSDWEKWRRNYPTSPIITKSSNLSPV